MRQQEVPVVESTILTEADQPTVEPISEEVPVMEDPVPPTSSPQHQQPQEKLEEGYVQETQTEPSALGAEVQMEEPTPKQMVLEVPFQPTEHVMVQTPQVQARTVVHVQESPLAAIQLAYEQVEVSTSDTQQLLLARGVEFTEEAQSHQEMVATQTVSTSMEMVATAPTHVSVEQITGGGQKITHTAFLSPSEPVVHP